VIARIGRLGTLCTQHRHRGRDRRVVDLDARLQAAQTSADRLRELLANSGGVGDLLNVESQLTTREASRNDRGRARRVCAPRSTWQPSPRPEPGGEARRSPPRRNPGRFRRDSTLVPTRSPNGPGDRGDGRRAAAVPADPPCCVSGWWLAGDAARPMSALPDASARSARSFHPISVTRRRPMLRSTANVRLGEGHGMDAAAVSVVRALPVDRRS